MKNQYFGDNRDLFKYDLVMKIVSASLVDHFIFIPMLTPDVLPDENTKSYKREGEQRDRNKARAGTDNKELVSFLNKFECKSKRDIRELRDFLKGHGIEAVIFGDDFDNTTRKKYFLEVNKKLLPKSLIFVDPDKGLEIKRTRDEHIKYCEVKSLYCSMDTKSILMIFQYFPRIRTKLIFRSTSMRDLRNSRES